MSKYNDEPTEEELKQMCQDNFADFDDRDESPYGDEPTEEELKQMCQDNFADFDDRNESPYGDEPTEEELKQMCQDNFADFDDRNESPYGDNDEVNMNLDNDENANNAYNEDDFYLFKGNLYEDDVDEGYIDNESEDENRNIIQYDIPNNKLENEDNSVALIQSRSSQYFHQNNLQRIDFLYKHQYNESNRHNTAISKNYHLHDEKIHKKNLELAEKKNALIIEEEKIIAEQMSENIKYEYFLNISENVLKELNKNDAILIFRFENTYWFRTKKSDKFETFSKDELSIAITSFLNKDCLVVYILNTKNNSKNQILINSIPKVDKIIFNPLKSEFYQENNNTYFNKYTPHNLISLIKNENKGSNKTKSQIIDILRTISKESSHFLLDWIAYICKSSKDLNIGITLTNNKAIAEKVILDKILKPIFGYEYIIIIDDEMLKDNLSNILNKGVFYYIDEYSKSNENIEKINDLIQAVMIDKYVYDKKNKKQLPVIGQHVIISEKAISSHIEDYLGLFENIVLNESSIVFEKLNVSSIPELQLKFNENELIEFCYNIKYYDYNIPTISNKININEIKSFKQEIVNDNEKIDEFVIAIKEQNIDYFKAVKENEEIYSQLKFATEDGFFIYQDLYQYYKLINKNSSILKDDLQKRLKEKDEMFTQECDTVKAKNIKTNENFDLFNSYKTTKKTGNKKLYKIKDYMLSKKITVPRDCFITNKHSNNRFNYNYEDIEQAKNLYEKFDKTEKSTKKSNKM